MAILVHEKEGSDLTWSAESRCPPAPERPAKGWATWQVPEGEPQAGRCVPGFTPQGVVLDHWMERAGGGVSVVWPMRRPC